MSMLFLGRLNARSVLFTPYNMFSRAPLLRQVVFPDKSLKCVQLIFNVLFCNRDVFRRKLL